MVSDLDIYRSAWLMVRQHGDDAVIQAAMRADELLERGDLEGQRAWLRIVDAIGELLSKEVPADAVRH